MEYTTFLFDIIIYVPAPVPARSLPHSLPVPVNTGKPQGILATIDTTVKESPSYEVPMTCMAHLASQLKRCNLRRAEELRIPFEVLCLHPQNCPQRPLPAYQSASIPKGPLDYS